jgi:uncharacterized protein YidB (DUF937 family)
MNLTTLLNALGQNSEPSRNDALLQAVAKMLIGGQGGGQSGLNMLVQQFQKNGLDQIIQSWIGSAENQSINSAQVQQTLGDQQVQTLAKESGLSVQQTAQELTALLPMLIDKLTPMGKIDATTLSQLLGTLLSNKAA